MYKQARTGTHTPILNHHKCILSYHVHSYTHTLRIKNLFRVYLQYSYFLLVFVPGKLWGKLFSSFLLFSSKNSLFMKLCQKWLLVKASFFKRKKAENLFHTRDNTQYKKSSHFLLYAFHASILWYISLFDCTLCHCFSIIYSIWILSFRQTNCGVFFCCFDVIMTTTPCYYLCSTTFKKVLLRIHIFTYAA